MNDTKKHILETSLTLFLQKSYRSVTMKEIVETSSVSKGAFYYYFESKEELFVEVVEYYHACDLRLDFTQFSQDSLKAFYNDHLASIRGKYTSFMLKEQNKRENYHLLLFEANSRVPTFQKMFVEEKERELNAWANVIRKAKKSGEIETDLTNKKIARMFVNINDGIGLNAILRGEHNVEKVIHEIKNLWDNLYRLLKG